MRKYIKIYILFFILVFVDLNANAQNLKFKFSNKTGKNIDSLFVNGKLIVHLDKDSTSKVVVYNSMTFDSGTPIISMSAYIDNNKVYTRRIPGFCGTEMKEIKTGDYFYYLRYFKTPNDTFITATPIP